MSVSITQFQTVTGFVYRSVTVTDYLASSALITPAQATAVLAAYNASITVGPPLATLADAAKFTQDNCAALWVLGTLTAKTTTYGNALLATFPDQDENGRPVANWGTLIVGLASTFT
jgi:hypothetical protein